MKKSGSFDEGAASFWDKRKQKVVGHVFALSGRKAIQRATTPEKKKKNSLDLPKFYLIGQMCIDLFHIYHDISYF